MTRYIAPLLLCLFALNTQAKEYSVAAYAWKPFIDLEAEHNGISIELIRQFFATQGDTIKVVPMPWVRSLNLLKNGKVDILPAVWFTQERTETMIYSESYISNRLVFIKSKDNAFEYDGLESLSGKVVGVVREYAYGEEFLADPNIIFSVADSLLVNTKKVISGRIELTLDDEIAARAELGKDILDKIEFTKNPLQESPLYITCLIKNPDCKGMIESFNAGLEEVQRNGELKKLLSGLGI